MAHQSKPKYRLVEPVDEGPMQWAAWVKNFRVLVLLRADSSEAPLRGQLEKGGPLLFSWERQFRIERNYEALSYAWGHGTPNTPIILDGYGRYITANLAAALCHLRHRERDVRLWVDAICIDQDDKIEKALFIPKMHHIYSMASTTFVWLGEAADGSDDVFTFIEGKECFRTIYEHERVLLYLRTSLQLTGIALQSRTRLDQNDIDISGSLFQKLDCFAKRPWWIRTWVKQEVAHSKNVVLMCGNAQTTLNAFKHGIAVVLSRLTHMGARYPGRSSIGQLTTVYSMEATGSFLYGLLSARKGQASDLRDKVYGALRISEDEIVNQLPIDYTKSVAEVCVDAARLHLKNTQDLALLALCDFADGDIEESLGERPVHISGLPSWTSNWANRGPYTHLVHNIFPPASYAGKGYDQYLAISRLSALQSGEDGFGYEGEQLLECDLHQSNDSIRVKGTFIDSVRMISPVLEGSGTYPQTRLSCLEFLVENPVLSKGWRKFEEIDSRLLRTMTCNRNIAHQRFPEPVEQDLKQGESEVSLAASKATYFRRLFISATNRMCLGPRDIEFSDCVVLVAGCRLPLVMRRVNLRGFISQQPDAVSCYYTLIGVAYVEGIMEGELQHDIGSDEKYFYRLETMTLK